MTAPAPEGTLAPVTDLPPFWAWYHRVREHFAPPFFALSLTAHLLIRDFHSPWLLVAWGAMGMGFVTAGDVRWPPRWVIVGMAALLFFQFLAAAGSILWGSGQWVRTMGIAGWGAPLALFAFAPRGERILPWMIPTVAVHAIIVASGLISPANHEIYQFARIRSGLTLNPNIGAGLLVIGIVYLVHRGRWGLVFAGLLFVALLFTGSRWALLVAMGVSTLMLLPRQKHWSSRIGILAALTLIIALLLTVPALGAQQWRTVAPDLSTRLLIPSSSLMGLPRGVIGTSGLHNVPLRIIAEDGIFAGIIWLGLTGWALTRQPGSSTWWVLITVVLLGMLDYYVWMGHLGGVWWLTIGILCQAQLKTSTPAPPAGYRRPRSLVFFGP